MISFEDYLKELENAPAVEKMKALEQSQELRDWSEFSTKHQLHIYDRIELPRIVFNLMRKKLKEKDNEN